MSRRLVRAYPSSESVCRADAANCARRSANLSTCRREILSWFLPETFVTLRPPSVPHAVLPGAQGAWLYLQVFCELHLRQMIRFPVVFEELGCQQWRGFILHSHVFVSFLGVATICAVYPNRGIE